MASFQKMLYDCYNQPQPTAAASIPDIQNKLAINTINYSKKRIAGVFSGFLSTYTNRVDGSFFRS
ncbi:hypothetical protein J3L18_07825 [Mucilaginibacter gossypii]|uniref:hypothetical protein n=1 Tax=Mucilaginibacter gossypii TaxID=551996 RepID=UPI000DCE4A3D|nr:hypothetical protein [Mucilaginibacter gossypii]QTE38960.1 hypothetical protein J3L18_07825 [Mucilaginibacter gossypii]RAV53537.1 hypothetical protein DIU36_22905 [Mucilaginibacter rubeus]